MTTLRPAFPALPTEQSVLGGAVVKRSDGSILKLLKVRNPDLFNIGGVDPELICGIPFTRSNEVAQSGMGFLVGKYGNPILAPASVSALAVLGGRKIYAAGKEKTVFQQPETGIYRMVVWDIVNDIPTMVHDFDFSVRSDQSYLVSVKDSKLTVYVDDSVVSLADYGVAFVSSQDEFRYSNCFELHLLPQNFCREEVEYLELGTADFRPGHQPIPSLGNFTLVPSNELVPAPVDKDPWLTTGSDAWQHVLFRSEGWKLHSFQILKGKKAFYELRTTTAGEVILVPEPEYEDHPAFDPSGVTSVLPVSPGRVTGFIGKSDFFVNRSDRRKSLTHWQVLPNVPSGFRFESGVVELTPAETGIPETWYPGIYVIKHPRHFATTTRDLILRPQEAPTVLDLSLDQLLVATFFANHPASESTSSPTGSASGRVRSIADL